MWEPKIKLSEVHRTVGKINLFEGEPELLKVAIILWSSLFCGGNINKTINFTKENGVLVSQTIQNAEKNGIIKGGLFYIKWDRDNFDFFMDCMVAAGELIRTKGKNDYLYALPGTPIEKDNNITHRCRYCGEPLNNSRVQYHPQCCEQKERERSRRRYWEAKKNPEKYKKMRIFGNKSHRKWELNNWEHCKIKQREWTKANRAKCRNWHRQWYQNNLEHCRGWSKNYRIKKILRLGRSSEKIPYAEKLKQIKHLLYVIECLKNKKIIKQAERKIIISGGRVYNPKQLRLMGDKEFEAVVNNIVKGKALYKRLF